MRTQEIKSVTLDQIEDIALYIGLSIVLILEFMSSFVTPLNNLLSEKTILLYALTIITFRILLKNIVKILSLLTSQTATNKEFNEEIRKLIKNRPRIKTLDFLATNTRKFYHAIEDLDFHVDHIRILIYERTPNIDNIIERWKTLEKKGVCKSFQIKTYNTTPTFYGMVIDKKDGCFGFFDPGYMTNPKEHLGVMLITGPYILSTNSPMGREILTDIQNWFDELFTKHAKELYSVKKDESIK
jgi:hypothetical protein